MRKGEVAGRRMVAGFEVLAAVGSGGEAIVCRARELATEREVALKLFHVGAPLTERFAGEALCLQQFRDPRVVGYVDHGIADGQGYIAMEWLEGETLSQRLQRQPLSSGDAVRVVRRLAEALALVHRRGLVHRDVKPSNVFLRDGAVERVTLLDFGIALPGGEDWLRDQTPRGTPAYVAPEQARGETVVDARADVFALGCVLHRCLTGAPPFPGDSVVAVLSKIVLAPAPRLPRAPGTPPALDDLVQRMLAKSPAQRPADAGEVVELLDAVARGDRARVTAPTAITSTEPELVSVVVMGASPMRGPLGWGEAASTGPGAGASPDTETAATAASARELPIGATERVAADISHLGGHLDRLVSGTVLVTVMGGGGPRRNAERAARCALRLQAAWPSHPIAVATARGLVALNKPIGDAVDGALALLAALDRPGISVDYTTAALVDGAFVVERAHARNHLRAARPVREHGEPVREHGEPLVGRVDELAALTAAWERARGGVATTALVTGPPGIGKSRLARGAIASLQAADPDARVGACHGEPLRSGSSFAGLAGLLRGWLGVERGAGPLARRRAVAQRLAELRLDAGTGEGDRERLAAAIGFLLAPESGIPDALRPLRNDPQALDRLLVESWLAWMAAETRRRPVAIVVEDLQWLDAATIRYLTALLARSRGADARLLIVGVGRPEVHARFAALWPGGLDLRLGALSPAQCRELAERILGGRATAARVDRIVAESAGNALAVRELVWLADEATRTWSPESLSSIMLARLALLAPAARRVARAASVFGERFSAAGAAAVAGEPQLAEALRLLITVGVVHRAEGGGDAHIFHHAALRDAAYSLLTDDDRAVAHGRAAAWLEASGGADAAELADHWCAAHRPDRAAPWYLAVAERALAGGELDEADRLARVGLERGFADADRAALQLVGAEVANWQTRYAAALELADAVIAQVPRGSDPWFRAMAARTWAARGDLDGVQHAVRPLCEEIEATRRRGGAISTPMIHAAANALHHSITVTWDAALIDRLLAFLDEVEATQDVEPAAAANVSVARGYVDMYRGASERAYRHFMRAVELYEGIGMELFAVNQRNNAASVCTDAGRFDVAEALLRDTIARRARHRLPTDCTDHANLGMALLRLGRPAAARAELRRALEMGEPAGVVAPPAGAAPLVRTPGAVPFVHGVALLYLAQTESADGEPAEAVALARRAREVLRPWPSMRVLADATLAIGLVALDQVGEAEALIAEAIAAFQADGVQEQEHFLRLAQVRVLAAAGRHAGSDAALAAALRRIEAIAAAMSPEWRRGFLASIAEVRALRALAAHPEGT